MSESMSRRSLLAGVATAAATGAASPAVSQAKASHEGWDSPMPESVAGRSEEQIHRLCAERIRQRRELRRLPVYLAAAAIGVSVEEWRAFTPADADDWRRWLSKQGRQKKTLGKNSIRRHCGRAKQFFRAAVRKRLIADNPFAEVKDVTVRANRERDYFITREEAYKVLEACPTTQDKLLFALSRFGGLRCPSEHRALQWPDVDFGKWRMTIRSPKTEHHDGKECRVIPIFPELRPYLEAAKAEAEKGAKYVITIANIRSDKYANPRTQMERIIKRAGLKPWPKLFHNLRASRETE